jgi:hypothetical protein
LLLLEVTQSTDRIPQSITIIFVFKFYGHHKPIRSNDLLNKCLLPFLFEWFSC